MFEFIEKITVSLLPLTDGFVPPGSEPKALAHQWAHALAYGNGFFASYKVEGISARENPIKKDAILRKLKKDGLYITKKDFKKRLLREINIEPPLKPLFRFIDLFAGIGGMRQGFESAGGVCVFSSEFEKNAQQTYFTNYGEFPFGDITNVSEIDIPEHDVLVAGFPCQPFSHAGLKLGIDDTRGTLFYDIARILKERQPKVALLENVRGLISHDKGHTLRVVLKLLTKIGYRCSISEDIIEEGDPKVIKKEATKMVLKSKDFGVPQNRQRIYIVLWRKDLGTDFVYPEPRQDAVRVGDILEENPDPKYTISKRLWDGHKRRKVNNKKNGKGFGYGLVTPDSEYTNTISARYYKDGSEALIAQPDKNPRKITPREAARLQGFPENFILNQSDVQAYKQFGNSVTVDVIKELANNILEVIEHA